MSAELRQFAMLWAGWSRNNMPWTWAGWSRNNIPWMNRPATSVRCTGFSRPRAPVGTASQRSTQSTRPRSSSGLLPAGGWS